MPLTEKHRVATVWDLHPRHHHDQYPDHKSWFISVHFICCNDDDLCSIETISRYCYYLSVPYRLIDVLHCRDADEKLYDDGNFKPRSGRVDVVRSSFAVVAAETAESDWMTMKVCVLQCRGSVDTFRARCGEPIEICLREVSFGVCDAPLACVIVTHFWIHMVSSLLYLYCGWTSCIALILLFIMQQCEIHYLLT